MRVNSTLSSVKDINMGAPQGGVSSPIIFTLYTNSCKSKHSELYVIKFSDDTALLSLLYTHSDTTVYHTEVQRIVSWCDGHNLILNATKTKEMVFHPRSVGDHKIVSIKGQLVKQVTQFKYLGITLDCKLQWSFHVEYVCSKICQRLYFLRRLRVHGVGK